MHAIQRWSRVGGRGWRRARWLVLVVALSLTTVAPAWAKGQKVEAPSEPTKSYALPYMIVLALVGLGLMTVLRPGKRLDKPGDKLVSDDDD